MINTYTLQIHTACPVNDGDLDLYTITVSSPTVINVERIVEFFEQFSATKILQEDLTLRAAVALGAKVESVGVHSGITVRSVAP